MVEKRCWKCFLLEKSRLGELVISLLVTIVVAIIGLVVVAESDLTEGQKNARKYTLIADGTIGGAIVLCLLGWIIGRNCYLNHPHTGLIEQQQAIQG